MIRLRLIATLEALAALGLFGLARILVGVLLDEYAIHRLFPSQTQRAQGEPHADTQVPGP